MLFNSIDFLFFFPLVTILYYAIPHKYRWFLLLMASCVFYMWFIPQYILILSITIVIDYIAGILIERTLSRKRKKLYLIISIISTCLVLFLFKYFNFFNANLAKIAQLLDFNYSIKALEIILPLGLSFHTLQSLAYIIEVYRGEQKAEYNFGIYSLYVMFYPQLVAGPIERPQNLLRQFYEKHSFDYKRVTDGLKLMVVGLFKKIVIADRLAIFVNQVYDSPTQYNGLTLVVATVLFAFQVYCDFSGYSDIAIGSAKTMGFRLMTNFNTPYFSKSISEFWTRWHISFNTWLRDYILIPLSSRTQWYFNLFIVFLVSGLWHGADWTYIIFGIIQGSYFIFSIWTKNLRLKIRAIIRLNKCKALLEYWQIFTTFSLICFSLIFFRAKNIGDAFYIVTHLLRGWGGALNNVLSRVRGEVIQTSLFGGPIQIVREQFVIMVVLLILFIIVQSLENKGKETLDYLSRCPVYVRWSFWYSYILGLFFLGVKTDNVFIYFQF